jgi:methylphosphotriester-DNA--protein-cysteine methyltransferase
MKKRRIVLAGLFIFFIFVSTALGADYVGSKNATTYHNPTCRIAKKISAENLVKFNSPEEAKAKGYGPCKICKPPLPK